MTIISYSEKRTKYLSDSNLIFSEGSFSWKKIFFFTSPLLLFISLYIYFANWQTSAAIEIRKTEAEIKQIKIENNILKTKLAEIDSLERTNEISKKSNYQLENHPEYFQL